MIIEFSVSNYRSIRDKQTLSLVADNRIGARNGDKSNQLIEIDMPGLSNTKLLKSAVFYGANASGKSNIVKAAEFFQKFVETCATDLKPDADTGVVPFRLDPFMESSPSEFEVVFTHKDVRYQYGVKLDRKWVHEEWLTAYPNGLPQRWFFRCLDIESGVYDWTYSTKLKGDKESLKNKVRENTLFLSVAAQFNHEQLSSVYEWFSDCFRFIDFSDPFFPSKYTEELILSNHDIKKTVDALIRSADFGITGILTKKVNPDEINFPDDIPAGLREFIKKQAEEGGVTSTFFSHCRAEEGEDIGIGLPDESAGTQKFFALLGPWLDMLKNGYTFFIDELGAKMHPLLVRKLLEMVHDPEINQSGAQVVITTHDTTLLDSEIFRRDQIWFTEKDQAGSTNLYPLTDYKPRTKEALQKGYLAGRYGAIPFLGDFRF